MIEFAQFLQREAPRQMRRELERFADTELVCLEETIKEKAEEECENILGKLFEIWEADRAAAHDRRSPQSSCSPLQPSTSESPSPRPSPAYEPPANTSASAHYHHSPSQALQLTEPDRNYLSDITFNEAMAALDDAPLDFIYPGDIPFPDLDFGQGMAAPDT